MSIEKKYDTLSKLTWGQVKNTNTSSWAVWAEPQGDLSIVKNLRTNIDDVSMINNCETVIDLIKTDYVFVGLNASEGNKTPDDGLSWHSFHSAKSRGNDYKLRWAFMDPEIRKMFWGSYITDIFKDYKKTNSSEVVGYYKNPKNIDELRVQLSRFDEELSILKPKKIIVMGVAADYFVRKYYTDKFDDIITLNHYACNMGYREYRECFRGKLLECAE